MIYCLAAPIWRKPILEILLTMMPSLAWPVSILTILEMRSTQGQILQITRLQTSTFCPRLAFPATSESFITQCNDLKLGRCYSCSRGTITWGYLSLPHVHIACYGKCMLIRTRNVTCCRRLAIIGEHENYEHQASSIPNVISAQRVICHLRFGP